jgi:ribose-phosphate pyrophosphokinase
MDGGRDSSLNSKNSNNEMRLFSGTSHPDLAKEIAEHLEIKLGKIAISRFACGEIYSKIEENVRGAATFVIQTASRKVNEELMELFIILDALKRSSASGINVVMPHFGYARQDKKSAPREPISGRLIADLLTAVGINRIITVDLHSDQIQGFFNVPVDHLTAIPLFANYLKEKNIPNPVVVAPDTGRVKTAKKLADRIGAPLAILHKSRPGHNIAEIMHVVGEVKGKNVILVDDMIDTAGSITRGIDALLENGANPGLHLVATHPVFSPPATERIRHAAVKEVAVTNTIPILPEDRFPQLKVLSIAPLLAEAIRRNYLKQSISELFD